ncbi:MULTISPECIES: hypothetical protein [unclassified Streptomyces]|uniref:hypothetical protein n=1 Tax=unclassified Streptomyces TaxID=2593676 RepID=UPI0022569833|nr:MULTISPECIES: hypothetical protein [unclassified Streptomyces]MCX5123698.1 hypothetical protein [Streptomyces sp. NBC_00347]MCX5405759.1 hypothetical protein [Streptomyces sp. NBC_00086]
MDIVVTSSTLLDWRNEHRGRRLKQLLADREAYERRRGQAAQDIHERCIAHETNADRLRFQNMPESRRLRELAHVELDTALDPIPRERQALEAREATLRAHWNDPVVWIRTTLGARLKIYHHSLACGRVSGTGRHPDSFQTHFESEAAALGLTPCRVDQCRQAGDELERLLPHARP